MGFGNNFERSVGTKSFSCTPPSRDPSGDTSTVVDTPGPSSSSTWTPRPCIFHNTVSSPSTVTPPYVSTFYGIWTGPGSSKSPTTTLNSSSSSSTTPTSSFPTLVVFTSRPRVCHSTDVFCSCPTHRVVSSSLTAVLVAS